MTVRELTRKLQEFNQDFDVMFSGYEGGYQTIQEIGIIRIQRNVHKDDEQYYGPHEICADDMGGELVVRLHHKNTCRAWGG